MGGSSLPLAVTASGSAPVPHLAAGAVQAPASWKYADEDFPWAVADYVYMVGGNLFPVDVCTSSTPSAAENTTSVHLPPGDFFLFNTSKAVTGNQTITRTNVPLSEMDVYVAQGSVLALNRAVVQHTGELGGALELHVYGGRDAVFTLVEADGTTVDYESGATRDTVFSWSDATSTLSWKVSVDKFPGRYDTLHVRMFQAGQEVVSADHALGTSGSLHL